MLSRFKRSTKLLLHLDGRLYYSPIVLYKQDPSLAVYQLSCLLSSIFYRMCTRSLYHLRKTCMALHVQFISALAFSSCILYFITNFTCVCSFVSLCKLHCSFSRKLYAVRSLVCRLLVRKTLLARPKQL